MTVSRDRHQNIEYLISAGRQHLHGAGLKELRHFGNFLLCDFGQDLQPQIRTAAYDTSSDSGLQALHATCIGYRHGLYIFNDIATDLYPAGFRCGSQCLCGLSRRQRHSNGLRAAHRWDQLFL